MPSHRGHASRQSHDPESREQLVSARKKHLTSQRDMCNSCGLPGFCGSFGLTPCTSKQLQTKLTIMDYQLLFQLLVVCRRVSFQATCATIKPSHSAAMVPAAHPLGLTIEVGNELSQPGNTHHGSFLFSSWAYQWKRCGNMS